MAKRHNPDQILLDLARNEGQDVVHLPYTPEFESICGEINPNATIDDKHGIWEKLLDLRPIDTPLGQSDASAQSAVVDNQPPNSPISSVNSPAGVVETSNSTGWLFPIHERIDDLQPWSGQQSPSISPDLIERRQKMLADIANSYLATREQRVAHLLQKFPETRDSDTALCIKYWKMYQADVLERWQPLELEVLFELDRIETIGRVRRMIQNDLHLFRGVEETRSARVAMQREFHEYIAAHRGSLPEVRFYLDETGNDGHTTYTGVAGICIINWKQFEKHHAALELWRSKVGWPETVHFSDTSEQNIGRAVSLLRQLKLRRYGILFLGYSLLSRGRTHEDMYSLFIQLVVDSLKYLGECKCLSDNRSIRVIKEADSGFDKVFLQKMTKQLGEMVALEFPGQLNVLPVEAVPKGRTVLLECADLIAGGMQRRALRKGRNPKDRLAEAVMNVTGFEDESVVGTIFNYHATKG
jgi:hypothetical protein